jgi:hypothetical protein
VEDWSRSSAGKTEPDRRVAEDHVVLGIGAQYEDIRDPVTELGRITQRPTLQPVYLACELRVRVVVSPAKVRHR